MPCYTQPTCQEIEQQRIEDQAAHEQPLREEIDVLKLELAEREAMLCGVLTAASARERLTHERLETSWSGDGPRPKVTDEYLLEEFRRTYDETKAGVTWNDLMEWWKSHQVQDRLKAEQAARDKEERRRDILGRLTTEEQEILGLEIPKDLTNAKSAKETLALIKNEFAVWRLSTEAGQEYLPWDVRTTTQRVTIEQLKACNVLELYQLGFANWDEETLLLPLWILGLIADGEILTSISGGSVIVGQDAIDTDTRGVAIAYGFSRSGMSKGNRQ